MAGWDLLFDQDIGDLGAAALHLASNDSVDGDPAF